jgi:hypothetical protein
MRRRGFVTIDARTLVRRSPCPEVVVGVGVPCTMPLMSSKMTFFYKRISPIIWFGVLAVFILVGLLKGAGSLLVVTVLLAIVSYQFMKRMVFNLVDEVFDVGDALLVRSGGREERIALADIKNVNYSPHMSPPQVTPVAAAADRIRRHDRIPPARPPHDAAVVDSDHRRPSRPH